MMSKVGSWFAVIPGTRHGEVPPRGESKIAAPHIQLRDQRLEPGGEFSEGGPVSHHVGMQKLVSENSQTLHIYGLKPSFDCATYMWL